MGYHRNSDTDSDLQAAHQKTKEALKATPAKNAVYHKFILPEGFKVDNMILSGNATSINKNKNGIKYTYAEKAKKMEIPQYFVNWTIAKKGSGRKIKYKNQDNFLDDFN